MFRKLTVLDNVILFPEHYRRLAACSRTIELDLGLSDEDLEKRITLLEGSGAAVQCVTECRSERLSDDDLLARLQGTDCLVTCWQPMSEPVLRALAGTLKLVLYWTDITRADRSAAKRVGIVVDNIPEYGVRAVSEWVFAGLLELLRRPALHHRRACSGTYDYENFKTARKGVLDEEEVRDETLHGKHLGVIGLGRIGSRVASIARSGFDMRVSYYSRRRQDDVEAGGVTYLALEAMFEECDIVSLHLPPGFADRLIDKTLLARLRPDSVLVNTSSAAAVDYDALLSLLSLRRFRAVLDVFPGLPPRKLLQGLDNVFFTYRAAWFTRQSLKLKGDILIQKLERHAAELGTA